MLLSSKKESCDARKVRIYNTFDFETAKDEIKKVDSFTRRMALEFAFKGVIQKTASNIYRVISETFNDRRVTYPA